MNGSSWLTSSKPAPQRARMSPPPTLNTLCSARAGKISSQYRVGGSPAMSDDDEQHGERQDQLLQLDQHVAQRQARPGKVQRPDQRQRVPDHLGGRDERPLGEVEHEDAGDQERDVVRDAPAGVQQHAEDQVVDARVEQRGEHLPQLAEPGLGVHRDVPRGGEAADEVTPLPELGGVAAQRRPHGRLLEPVAQSQVTQRLVGQQRVLRLGGHGGCIVAPRDRPAEPPGALTRPCFVTTVSLRRNRGAAGRLAPICRPIRRPCPASPAAIRQVRPATRREPGPELYGATVTLENVPSGQLCGTTVT